MTKEEIEKLKATLTDLGYINVVVEWVEDNFNLHVEVKGDKKKQLN